MAFKRQTPEEKEKRKQELLKKCEDIINNFQDNPAEIVEFLKFNSKFYRYSKNNNILIYSQNENANFCASFAKFKEMGYSVKKGEHGMKILVPYITKLFYDSQSEEWKKVSQATKEEKEKIKNGELRVKEHVSFGVGTVFDIAQTDCPVEDYPKYFGFGNQSKSHKQLYNALVSYSEQRGIPVEIKDVKNVYLAGYYTIQSNSITLSDKLQDDRRLSVMTHELSHALLHNSLDVKDEKSLPQIEFEADALSLLFREHLGITEIEAARQSHLQNNYKKYLDWAEENKDNQHCPDISEILDNINNVYSGIVEEFDKAIEHYFEIHPDTVQKLTLDEYLAQRGLRSPVDDFMIDKLKLPHGQSKYDERKMHENAQKSRQEYHAKREAAIKEYYSKIDSGEIVQPTQVERYIKAAQGHPDNASTQAAQRILKKRGYTQDNNGNWIKQSDVKTDFARTIDNFLNGNINPKDHIFVCPTTEVMKICGADNLDVMIYQDTIKKILSDDANKFEHPHNLTPEILKQLPNQLERPIMVFEGSHKGSIVLITDLQNQSSEQIIISCELNSVSQRHEINRITSMYGKENISRYLETQIKKDNLIGCQKNIANQMLQSVGLYLPSEETFIDYTDIISDIDENVNNQITENSSNTYDELAVDNVKDRLSNEVLAHLQMFVDSDIQIYGEIQESTLNAIDMQGYKYIDGKFEKATEHDFGDENGKQIRFKILPADPVTEYLYNVQVHFKYDFTEEFVYSGMGRFCKNLDEVDKYIIKIEDEYSERGYTFSYEGREELIQKQHYDMLKTIAKYEQELNVSPKESIVEMNYSTAHWQAKDGIDPLQIESVYNHITDNHHLSFNRVNNIRINAGNMPYHPDDYYQNIKYNAFVENWNFGNNNEINLAAISSALKEVPVEYVLDKMTQEQRNLFADFYETSMDYDTIGLNEFTPAETELYNTIITNRKNNEQIVNENKMQSDESMMKASLTNYLKYNNQLPADVLSSKADIELYSFKSQINDTQKVENLLWKIQESDMQVVSMDGNNTDGFRLYKLNNEYQVQPYNYNTYPSESDAMHEVFSNNKIAKLIPYDSMKMAEFSKDLSPITESENLKYPYIQIVWSDNMKLNHTDILSIPEAKDKFNEVNNQVNDEPIKTSFSLYLDSNNIYNFNYLHSKDGISIPEHIKIHLQELQSQETLDESLENLNDYIAHELPDAEQLSFEESMESDFEI